MPARGTHQVYQHRPARLGLCVPCRQRPHRAAVMRSPSRLWEGSAMPRARQPCRSRRRDGAEPVRAQGDDQTGAGNRLIAQGRPSAAPNRQYTCEYNGAQRPDRQKDGIRKNDPKLAKRSKLGAHGDRPILLGRVRVGPGFPPPRGPRAFSWASERRPRKGPALIGRG